MELANIEKLLEKYLNAETTLQEENELRNYFTSDIVPDHLQEYQALFGYFSAEKNERFTKTIHLKTQKKKWRWLYVAASLALLVTVYSVHQNREMVKAEIAYADTQKALNMLASNLNKGTIAIGRLQEFETTKNKIFKQTK